MAGPTMGHVAEDTKELAAAISALRADLADLKAVFEKRSSHANAIENWIKNILIAVVLSAGGVIWGAAVLSTEVKHLGARVGKIEEKLDHLGARADKIDAKLDLIIQRLDQVVPKKGGL